MIRNVMKTLGSLRTALVVGVGIPLLIAASAQAQNANPAASPGTGLPENGPGPAAPPAPQSQGEASTERVVVTGSYIPTAEEVTASPLDTLTSQEVRRGGSTEILQTLQKRNPDFVGGGNLGSTNANIASGATLGGSQASIRGFPTLVLYEGRRIADTAAIAAGGFQFTDVGLFPAALISRIEVLKDGASATYGSEAVGGVINIFTKDDFQGAEIGFRYGTTVNGAVAERRGYAIGGVGNETTQVTAGMQYYEIDPLFERQRSYSNPTVGGTTTYAGSNRGPDVTLGADDDGAIRATRRYLIIGEDPLNYPGHPVANSPFNVGVTPGSIPAGVGFAAIPQFYQLANGTPVPPPGSDRGTVDAYNAAQLNEVLNFNLANVPTNTLDTSRTNVIVSASHQIFGKQLEMFGNFLYSNSDFRSYLNAQPLSNGTGVIIPAGHVGTDLDPNSPTYDPTIYNPFNYQIDSSTLSGANRTQVSQRYTFAPRIFDNQNNLYRFLGGLRSQINQDWMFETAAYYSKYDINFQNSNLVNASQLNSMIAGTALDNNGNPIPALDFFAINPIGTGPGQVSADQFSTIFGTNMRYLSSFQRVFDAKIVGFPFSLPAGKVGFSLGGEYRLEGFKVQDSPEIFVGSVPIQQIDVKRNIQSAFAELSIPIVGSAMHIPGVYSLELTLAGRYDHYEGISEDAKVPKVSLRYQPIKDLTLRATYSDSFIAPNLYQTNGPSSTGFSSGISFNGVPQDQAQVLTGSNRDLVPSSAETYTAGLVYSPSYLPGFTLSADYFRILQQNIVSTLGGGLILTSVENLGPASPYYDLVAFNNFPGRPGSIPVGGPGALNGNLSSTYYVDTNKNLGAQRTEGFDLSARYNMDLHAAGQLELGVNAVVFTKYDGKILPFGSPYYNLLGLTGGEGFGVIPDYKINGLVEYRLMGFTLSLNANYIPEIRNANGRDPSSEDQSTFDPVRDYFTVDGRLSYTFTGKTSAAAAVESKDAKSMVDSKGSASTTAAAGAETMSPVQKLLDGLTLTVGCNNMFDEQPPFVAGANGNTDLSVYDPYGQFVYFEISKKF